MFSITNKIILDLLNYAKDRDKLDLDSEKAVSELIEEMKKSKVIEQHPFSISEIEKHGEKYYITYLVDETKKNNRRQITSKSKENLENKIYEDYLLKEKKKEQKNINTFAVVYKKFMTTEKILSVSSGTLRRFNDDYLRFYKDSDFDKMDITKITRLDVKLFFLKCIKDNNLSSKSFSNMRTIAIQVFDFAIDLKLIGNNSASGIKINSSVFAKKKKKTEEEVFNYSEKEQLEKFLLTMDYHNTVPLGLALNFQLGLRVGELVALKWSDIKGNKIEICRMEKLYAPLDPETLEKLPTVHEIVNYPKTSAGFRSVLLTEKALKILERIREFNKTHNIKSDYIISHSNGRYVYKETINDTLYKCCEKADLLVRSNHKIRKTTLSAWLDSGMNVDKVCEMAGHEEIETTLKYYSKNRDSDEEILLKMASNL